MRKAIFITVLLCVLVCCISPAVYANAPGPNLDGTSNYDGVYSVLMIAVVIVIYLVMITFTCWMEWLVAGPFGFRPTYQKTILITNLITQLCMHFLELLSLTFGPRWFGETDYLMQCYFLTLLVLEVLVYVSEFLIYRRKMRDFSPKRILLYTVCANTASLLGGILLLMILI